MYQIERLKEIATQCTEGERIDPDVAQWFAESIRAFLSHRASSLDEALGLKMGRGGIPWWREEAIRQRDAALRTLRKMFYSNCSLNAAALEIERLSNRYAATAWRFHQRADSLPDEVRGTAQEWLWKAFSSGATMPIKERQLRNILQ